MEQRDLERIRFITRHFDELRGLAGKVPFGLFLLGSSIGLSMGISQMLQFSFIAGMAALGLKYRADLYYSRRFGYVEPVKLSGLPRSPAWNYVLNGPPLRAVAISSAGLMLACIPFAFAVVAFRSIFCPLWAGRLLVSWFRKKCPASQGYYAALSLLLLGFALRSTSAPLDQHLSLPRNDAACGAVLVLVGILDHWQLVRALKPLEALELKAAAEEVEP